MKKFLIPFILVFLFSCSESKTEKRPGRILSDAKGRSELLPVLKEAIQKDRLDVNVQISGDSSEHITLSGPSVNQKLDKEYQQAGLYKSWFELGFSKITVTNGVYKSEYTVE